ncbi:hypothetical protein TCAL_13277 [Tigriopus californicus]|uniref:C2 NT-type domain-containing protein n=1 Tax=Tigriopus californicus TaxID=6832 RepID=A0A553NF57_TIGCA|nr:hypothetical protein TCAL_13277 [Tigriopus californicus]|eukprot:TCALIF_13277-PA protein Name:"Similar to Ehbp1 EH domain-binding protein 1 (Mus musculus)" AED:0.09 eAED:0.34 QI:0/-1/0/1/-1/1/1/0/660
MINPCSSDSEIGKSGTDSNSKTPPTKVTHLNMFRDPTRAASINQDIRLFFSLTVTDLRLDTNGEFNPSKIILIIQRNGERYVSREVEWEPSLKAPRSGFAFFDPALTAKVSTSLRNGKNLKEQTKYKECSVAVYHLTCSAKRRRKLLAKVKFNLWSDNVFLSRDESNPDRKRLRLHPESKKISRCFVTMTVERVEPGVRKVCPNQDQVSVNYDVNKTGLPTPTNDSKSSSYSDIQKEDASDLSSSNQSLVVQKICDLDSNTDVSSEKSIVQQIQLPVIDTIAISNDAFTKKGSLQNSSFRVTKNNAIQISHQSVDKPNETALLHWAQERLDSKQIKATNLSTSWRSGVGFCHLFYQMYPDLIPLNELSTNSKDNNFGVLLDALSLVNVHVPENSDKECRDVTSPIFIIWMLDTLKQISETDTRALPPETIHLHQMKWHKRAGFFQCEMNYEESPEGTNVQFQRSELLATSPDGKNRLKVKSLICAAHNVSEEVHENMNVNNLDLDAKAASLCNELKNLDQEIALVNSKQIHLENVLRTTSDTLELPNLIQLVNQKNSLVRKQMQYNILMKQVQLELEQRNIMDQLRNLSLLPEGKKTQIMVDKETELFNRHVELVNEKDELVHHLHTQEQAIQEDEDIQEAIKTLPNRKEKHMEEECAIQ